MDDRAATPLAADDILVALVDHGVDFVVIGGLAAQTHGRMRMTADVDVIPGPERANLVRLAEALSALQARPLNEGYEDADISADLLPRSTIWQFATPAGGIDVIHEAPGGRPFPDLRKDALMIELDGRSIPIASLDDLIQMKLARGRPVDLEDVAELTDSSD